MNSFIGVLLYRFLGCESILRNVLQGLKVNIKKYEYMKIFVDFDCLLVFLKD